MAELVITDSQNYMDIADAIRSKNGSSDTYTPREMAAAIEAIPQSGGNLQAKTNISPTTSSQTITPDTGYDGLSSVQINAMPSGTAGTPTATKGTVSSNSINVTPSVTNTTGYITGGTKTGTAVTVSASELVSGTKSITSAGNTDVTNYATASVAAGSATAASSISATGATVSTGTNTLTLSKTVSNTPQVTAGYVASGTAGNSSVSLTATVNTRTSSSLTVSGATITAPSGYYAADASKSVASGSASAPSTISGTGATVTTGTNSLTLSKTVSVTPTVSAGYVTNGTATNSTVSLSASVTTKGATTYTPTTSNQTIASGTYLTGAQTISGDSNLVAGNIKKDVSIFGVTGSYEGGGGGGIQVGYKSIEVESASSSISFSGLSGEPTAFIVTVNSNMSLPSGTPYTAVAVVYDGTNVIGQTLTNTSNAQVTYDGSSFSKSYSNGTLTISSTGANFKVADYLISYTYNGTAANINTQDVQVGSGATSITFTGLEDEPIWWSCIFKSNFGTSSGYQRVICVTDWDGMVGEYLDSSMHFGNPFTATYNNGSFTISSSGTNNGGYFHQPGYYQLTYAIGEASPYQKVSKTYYATTTAQTEKVSPSTGYDALAEVNVTVGALSQTNLTAANIKSGTTVTINNGNANVWSVLGTYSGGGGSVSYDTKTTTASNYPVSLEFTSMKGEPKAFVCRLNAQVSSSGNTTYYYIVDVAAFGTTTHGNCFRIGGTRRVENITNGYSWSYSGTTLTITSSAASRSASPGAFYSGSYELLYIY